jgi:hypothetical protein
MSTYLLSAYISVCRLAIRPSTRLHTYLCVAISTHLIPSHTTAPAKCHAPHAGAGSIRNALARFQYFIQASEPPDKHPARQTCQTGGTFTAGRISVSATSCYIMKWISTRKTGSDVFWRPLQYAPNVNYLVFQRLEKNVWSKLLWSL